MEKEYIRYRRAGGNMDIENARTDGVPCVNTGCRWWIDEADAQNCGGEYSDGDPCVSRCKEYRPQNIKEGEQHRTTRQIQKPGK